MGWSIQGGADTLFLGALRGSSKDLCPLQLLNWCFLCRLSSGGGKLLSLLTAVTSQICKARETSQDLSPWSLRGKEKAGEEKGTVETHHQLPWGISSSTELPDEAKGHKQVAGPHVSLDRVIPSIQG